MKNLLLFESHSTSLDNEKGIASGYLDTSLSENGREQAKDLGLRYKEREISLVYCSDLKRSFETTEIAFHSRDIPIRKDRRLREWDYGNFNGAPASEIEKMKLSYIRSPFPGGESLLDALKRISECIQTVPKGTILIIGHRSVYYTLEHLFCKRSLEDLLTTSWYWQPGWAYKR